jgi:hypothetical protein
MDVDPVVIDLFRVLQTPAALAFFIQVIRRNPSDVPDDLVEAVVDIGAPAITPLLTLLAELDPEDAGDVPFVLAALHVRNARILEALTARLENDPQDAALCLEMYGDPAAIPALEAALAGISEDDPRSRAPIQAVIETLAGPADTSKPVDEPFEIWPLYPEVASPDYGALEDEDRLAILEHGSQAVRAAIALSYQGSELSDEARASLIVSYSTPRQTPTPRCAALAGRPSANSTTIPICMPRC